MSHFLARLASGVTQSPSSASAPRLRPLVGSIYQPLGLHAAGEPAARPGMEAWQPDSSDAHSQSAQAPPAIVRTEPPHRQQASGREESALPYSAPAPSVNSQQSATVKPHQTLLPQQATEPLLHTEARNNFDERSQPVQPAIEGARVEPNRTPIPPPPANALQLLMPQAAIQPASRPASSQAKEPVRRAAQPSREPDEIHIHIGRVEVAAIAQPAARPAPAAPARRAMSLDEYLRRSNGRSR
jgi:hypothetical protein